MAGTYASLVVVLAVSALIGQAVFAACGRREWSWLSPAIGLGLIGAIAWAFVRLPGEGTTAFFALAVVAAASAAILVATRAEPPRDLVLGLALAAAAAALASAPFLIERRFGILGTSLNPDMSQHLFAANRLAHDGVERLISSGYPLGPHSIVVALNAIGVSLVHGFDGLTLAIAVAGALVPLELMRDLAPARRAAAALVTGFAYMAASYLIQGSFKEILEATLLLAFAIGLHEIGSGSLGGMAPAPRWRLLAGVPLATMAIGAVYAYSFPGLLWLVGALAIAAGAGAVIGRRTTRRVVAEVLFGRAELRRRALRAVIPPALVAVVLFAVAIAPELGRIHDFGSFETFDPKGAGLGNLFNPISPLEALGIWPSGDFRLDPGDGFAPAALYWAGGLLALLALGYGLKRLIRKGEVAVPAALASAFALYLYALLAGTPYQEAKAIGVMAPVAMVIPAWALLRDASGARQLMRSPGGRGVIIAGLSLAFLGAAAGCSLLALANGPVGPSSWSPAFRELRTAGALPGSTLVVASDSLLDDQHGFDFLAWELRGGRVCVERSADAPAAAKRHGVTGVLVKGGARKPPFAGLVDPQRHSGYTLWKVGGTSGEGTCPFYSDGARANPGG